MRTSEAFHRHMQHRPFGRGKCYTAETMAAPSTAASDLKLFAFTFAGGFLFVTIFLA
jgi:hypothetical protein